MMGDPNIIFMVGTSKRHLRGFWREGIENVEVREVKIL
jgi:hypothetical protein